MKRFLLFSLLLVLLGFLAAGCERPQTSQETTAPATETRTDAGITTEVKMKIADDELLDDSDIQVETENGLVRLHGKVTNQAQIERAREIATKVDGVKSVNVDLTVGMAEGGDILDETDLDEKAKEAGSDIAQAAGDATITSKVKLKLAADDVTDALDIDVDTRNGMVTLNGTVNSKTEAKRAVEVAKSVEDVKSVQSNLKIVPAKSKY